MDRAEKRADQACIRVVNCAAQSYNFSFIHVL